MSDAIQIQVDKAKFLEFGRVLKRAYRYAGTKVILTLEKNRLLIEFAGGGCELACSASHHLVAEVTTKAFVGIVTAYSQEKAPVGMITLTFRPGLTEFATPLAGAKAKFIKTSEFGQA